MRTDYGQREAIAAQGRDPRLFETTVERVLAGENGHVCAVETVRVSRGADGRLHPIEGTRRTLPCQLLLIAAGFVGCEAEMAGRFHFSLNARNLPDIPAAASINDAVEIAKKYEDEKIVSFINGILGAFVRAEFPDTPAKPAPEEA